MSSEIIRLLKFVVVGVFVTGVDFVSFWILLNTFEKFGIKKFWKLRITTISNIISFLIANSVSFILNSFFTFSDTHHNGGWVPYLLVSLFSLSISAGLIQLLTSENIYNSFNQRFFQNRLSQKHYALVIKLITVLITMVTNYFGYKYFVY